MVLKTILCKWSATCIAVAVFLGTALWRGRCLDFLSYLASLFKKIYFSRLSSYFNSKLKALRCFAWYEIMTLGSFRGARSYPHFPSGLVNYWYLNSSYIFFLSIWVKEHFQLCRICKTANDFSKLKFRGLSRLREWCQSFFCNTREQRIIWEKFTACMLSCRASRIYKRKKGRWLSHLILYAGLALAFIFWLANTLCLTGFSSNQIHIAERGREQLLILCCVLWNTKLTGFHAFFSLVNCLFLAHWQIVMDT